MRGRLDALLIEPESWAKVVHIARLGLMAAMLWQRCEPSVDDWQVRRWQENPDPCNWVGPFPSSA